ncbi:MAG: rod shape-determining protein RodA [Actinobacteria bacterium]|nr:rod shape-determining protein RodA [Actinomycetota bacterium]
MAYQQLERQRHHRRTMQAASHGLDRGGRTLVDRDMFARLDWVLLGACVAILCFGLLMVYSSSRNKVDDDYYFIIRQAVALVLGIGVFTWLLRVDYRKFRDFSMLAYVLTVSALFFVLTPIGSEAGGATSWYELPFDFQLQPAELAKFGLIVALAGYVNEHRGADIDPWRLTVIIALAAVPIGLVLLQPDLGTDMVLLSIVVGLLAVGGVRGRYLLALTLLAVTMVWAVIEIGMLTEYQLERLNIGGSGDDTQGSAYNQDQSIKTIGSGDWLGFGLFQGPQTRLGFVPEQHTDFIFTAVGEELGFVGAGSLLLLFAIVLWRTWRIAQLASDYYGTLVCAGVLAMFTFMIVENVGMCLGVMPVTGIPLPFMSYGGSAMITCCACMALVQNVYANRFN